MPNVYTRTGDKGQTGLFGGSRLPKQAPAVEAYGTVDEANSAIGAAKVLVHDDYHDILHNIQQRLFTLAAELASDTKGRAMLENKISQADVDDLEHTIDQALAFTGPARQFVVPGRDPASAALHQARTIVRRAERRVLSLDEQTDIRPELIRYLNRLSDTLYAIARVEETKSDLAVIEGVVRQAVEHLARESTPVKADGAMRLDLTTAKKLAEAAEAKGTAMGLPIVFAAVDAGGNLILVHRMPDSLLASIDIAINKAYTSAALKAPTEDLRGAGGVDGPLYGIETSNQGRIVLFGGGLPVFEDGRISGGIGVSGGTVEEDITIVTYAFDQVLRS